MGTKVQLTVNSRKGIRTLVRAIQNLDLFVYKIKEIYNHKHNFPGYKAVNYPRSFASITLDI